MNKLLNSVLLYAKIIIAGAMMSLLAAMPLIGSLLPKNTDYKQTTQEVRLVPGNNRIDNVSIIVSQTGKVVRADKIHRKVTHPVSGFRDSRSFLIGGMSFLALLGFCIFFLWYDKQPKTRPIIILKRYLWGLFFFVSLWFTYAVFFMKDNTVPEAFRYVETYVATLFSFVAGCCIHWYYHTIFKHRHSKIAGVISHILDIRYKHYPHVAQKGLHKREAWKETRKQIQDYEDQTFKTLEEIEEQPALSSTTRWYKTKLILIGTILSVLAIAPLLYQFVPRHVEYSEISQHISLKPGLNRIGQVSFILGSDGRVLKAEKTERHPVHKVFGHKNLRAFWVNAAPFFSCLSLCLFFFWYEQQERNRYVIALKKYVLTIFFLVSLYCVCWVLIPEFNPISDAFYYIGTWVAIGIGLGVLCYSCWHHSSKLIQLYNKLRSLILHVLQVSYKHYSNMAKKALGRGAELEEDDLNMEEDNEEDIKAVGELIFLFSLDDQSKLSKRVIKARKLVIERYNQRIALQARKRLLGSRKEIEEKEKGKSED